jgi:hypothetical protein
MQRRHRWLNFSSLFRRLSNSSVSVFVSKGHFPHSQHFLCHSLSFILPHHICGIGWRAGKMSLLCMQGEEIMIIIICIKSSYVHSLGSSLGKKNALDVKKIF